ncbi:MAG: 7TM-DISM domain-containing protein, partial [Sinobacterium sp.]
MKSFNSIVSILCFLCTFWHSKNIASEQVVISKHDSHINLLSKIEEKSLQLSDIQHSQDWQKNYLPNQVNQDKSLWGKFNIMFDNPDEQQYFLSIGNPQLDYVDIFLLDEKNRILGSFLMGSNLDYSKRALKHRIFIAPLSAEQQVV